MLEILSGAAENELDDGFESELCQKWQQRSECQASATASAAAEEEGLRVALAAKQTAEDLRLAAEAEEAKRRTEAEKEENMTEEVS